MAVTVTASNAQACVISTEHDLGSVLTGGGIYVLATDLATGTTADTFELTIYGKARSGDTERVLFRKAYRGGRTEPLVESVPVTSPHHLRATLKQTAGTARTIPWAIYLVEPGGGAGGGSFGGDLTGTIANALIGTGKVTVAHLAADAVTTAKVAVDAITEPKIATNAVTARQIASGGVGSAEIADNAVTGAKMLADTVTNREIAPGTVRGTEILDATITDAEVAAANKDGAIAVPSLRTLGAMPTQAAPGDLDLQNRGDLPVLSGFGRTRFPIGAEGRVLTAHPDDGAFGLTWDVPSGGGGGANYAAGPIVVAAPNAPQTVKDVAPLTGGAVCSAGSNHQTTINAALDDAREGQWVKLVGSFTVSFISHPANASYKCCLRIPTKRRLDLTEAVITLGAGQAPIYTPGTTPPNTQPDTQYGDMITNKVFNTSATAADERIVILGGVIDGNASTQPANGFDGIQWRNAHNCLVEGTTVKNIRGINGAGGITESFVMDSAGGSGHRWVNCRATADDAHKPYTSTGFSANSSESVWFVNCLATNLKDHGATLWNAHDCWYFGLHSYGNGGNAGRIEEGDHNGYIGCILGSYDSVTGAAGTSTADSGNRIKALGNGGNGMNIKDSHRSLIADCQIVNNGGMGIQTNGAMNCLVTGCVIADNGNAAGDYGIHMSDSIDSITNTGTYTTETYFRVRNTLIRNNALGDPDAQIYHKAVEARFPGASHVWPARGALATQPTLPASNSTTATRNFGCLPVIVYISGGTVSKVEVGRGLGTGELVQVSTATNCSFKLNTGDCYRLTYSSAPTMRWVVDGDG